MRYSTCVIFFIFGLLKVQAQHDSMDMKKGMNMSSIDTMPVMKNMQHHMSMSHIYSLNLPMGRNGSGTSWLPDASPMYAYMFHKHGWMFMLHENLFIRYNDQDFTNKGSRGNNEIDVPAWLMLMGQRQVGKNGLFHFSTMFSFDAFTAQSGGFPLLISNRRVL